LGSESDPVGMVPGGAGDEARYFGAVFDEFFEKIRRFAYFHTGDEHLADDIAAEVFARAVENIEKFTDRGGTVGPWLYGIAKNVVAGHYRSSGSRPTAPLDESFRAPADACPEPVVLRNLDHEGLYQALSTLGVVQRTILVLRFIEGYDVKTVARIVGKSSGAVRVQQHRALALLRAHFESEREYEEGEGLAPSTV
jgi:RNA polymerase sigma-70 factor (ECF subfamily)